MSVWWPRRRAVQLAGTALATLVGLASSDGAFAAGSTSTTAAPPPKAATVATGKPSTPGGKPHKTLEQLDATAVASMMGSKVQGPGGEDMGLVVDVVVDRNGRPRALVIDFGGFLGVGSRKIALDWRLVHFAPGGQGPPILVRVGRADLQAAPEYDPTAKSNKIVGPAVVNHPAPTDAGN
jgi:hypothetical protein